MVALLKATHVSSLLAPMEGLESLKKHQSTGGGLPNYSSYAFPSALRVTQQADTTPTSFWFLKPWP